MIRYIYYFLKAEKTETYRIEADNFIITVFKGDLKDMFPTCGRRAHDIYIDKEFNTIKYQDIIWEIIKPMANLEGGDGVVFI